MKPILQTLYDQIIQGKMDDTQTSVQAALDQRVQPEQILTEAMTTAMEHVGDLF